jgi:hypothetical protein
MGGRRVKLFPDRHAAGIFRGAVGSGLEFHADLTLPYDIDFHSVPLHGQFVLVELASPDEAVLGRITSVGAQGRLTSSAGEEYGIRAVSDDREVSEDLKKRYLRYKVDVRLLGVLRCENSNLIFSPSHRRLPHVGAKVAFLPDDVLEQVAGGNTSGADLGFFALGEFIYAGDDVRLKPHRWMQIEKPKVLVRFAIQQLVSRRSFVFARAGFGKSNLVKLLFANLYSHEPPTVDLRDGTDVPVGTVIFDPDGEYFWPDAKGRPALCDVPELEDRVVVFTDQEPPSPFYGSFVAGGVRLDIRQLPAGLVLSIALTPEQQDQQNVHKLKGLRGSAWREMVDVIYREGNSADEDTIRHLLNLQGGQDAELFAARANMTRVVNALHDPSSQMLSLLLRSLREGRLCVIDISRMRGAAGLSLSGIVLRHLFSYNQEQFTKADPEPIPTIAVIEEAQSVLGGGQSGESAYEEWVKEGRKYNLGAVLVTQQPGAIPSELLSQGDTWFLFHLLSAGDLRAIKSANSHFSDDMLSSLLNEPLPGNGVFWSSVAGEVDQAGNAYPIPLRVLSFEEAYEMRDPNRDKAPVNGLVARMASESAQSLAQAEERITRDAAEGGDEDTPVGEVPGEEDDGELDRDKIYREAAIQNLREDEEYLKWIDGQGAITWRGVIEALKRGVADDAAIPDLGQWAYELVPEALNAVYGEGKWNTEKRPSKSNPGRTALWVVVNKTS